MSPVVDPKKLAEELAALERFLKKVKLDPFLRILKVIQACWFFLIPHFGCIDRTDFGSAAIWLVDSRGLLETRAAGAARRGRSGAGDEPKGPRTANEMCATGRDE